MPIFEMVVTSDFVVAINYSAQGKVLSLDVTNNASYPVYAEIVLTDSRVFGQEFPPAAAVSINFPNNAVTVKFDAQGEPTWTGLAAIRTRTLGV